MYKKQMIVTWGIGILLWSGWLVCYGQIANGFKKLNITVDLSDYERVKRTIPQKVVNPRTDKNVIVSSHIVMNDTVNKITFLGYQLGENGYPNYLPEQQPCPLIARIFSQEKELLGEYGFLWMRPGTLLLEYDPTRKTPQKNPQDVDRDIDFILPRFDNAAIVDIYYGDKLILSFVVAPYSLSAK
jgi:hypothetical protein